jgi:hypothetical protein
MATSQYWTGQIPGRPIAIDVRDTDGRPVNLAAYTGFNVIVLGSHNEEIDLTGSQLNTSGANTGRFVFRWPTDRSVFEEPGEYLLQLELTSPTARDFTTEHNIKVRRLGGKN